MGNSGVSVEVNDAVCYETRVLQRTAELSRHRGDGTIRSGSAYLSILPAAFLSHKSEMSFCDLEALYELSQYSLVVP